MGIAFYMLCLDLNHYSSEGSLNQHVKNKHPELANNPEYMMNISNKKTNEENPKTKADLSNLIQSS